MICYLCGDFIRYDAEQGGEICPTCSMHYCYNCATNIETCYVCGSTPDKLETDNVLKFNPADILTEVATVEKRGQPRRKIKIVCAYTFLHGNGSGSRGKGYRALTRNVSKSGLCIYSLIPLEEGQKLNFKECPALGKRALAVVRWVKKVKKIYVAGLMFNNSKDRV